MGHFDCRRDENLQTLFLEREIQKGTFQSEWDENLQTLCK